MIILKDFYADWCFPCKMQSPILDELKKELPGLKVEKINIDQNQEEAAKYGVMSIPTLILEKDGEMVKKFVGVTYKDELKKAIKAVE